MIREKPEIAALVALVFEATVGLNRGDLITHKRIEELTGHRRNEQGSHWSVIIAKLKRRYRVERQITLTNERGVGYRLSTVEMHLVENPRRHFRRLSRANNRAVKDLEALPPAVLTLPNQNLRSMQIERMCRGRRQAKRDMREQRNLLRPTESVRSAARVS